MSRLEFVITDENRKSVWSFLDEIGLILDLKRIPGERNKEYRERLYRVFTRPTDSTYRGMLNAITYELGLDFYELISIDFIGGPTNVGLAAGETPQPRVTLKDGVLTLYGHYVNEDENMVVQVDNNPQVNLRKLEYADPEDLLLAIPFPFEATDIGIQGHVDGTGGPAMRYDWSYTLANVDSNITITQEVVPSSTRFILTQSPINEGQFYFDERRIFKTLKESENDLTQPGDFYLDVSTGEVVVASLPSGLGTVRYQYRNLPIDLEASPVSLGHIGSREMQRYFFTQLELSLFDSPLERFINNIPTLEGTEIINELYRASNNYWGI